MDRRAPPTGSPRHPDVPRGCPARADRLRPDEPRPALDGRRDRADHRLRPPAGDPRAPGPVRRPAMNQQRFSWRTPGFTYADALTGARLVMLPYLIYALAARLSALAVVTLAVMVAGESGALGAAFDSGIDFLVIYGLFTAYFALGILPWWKWIVIAAPAVLMAVTQILYLLHAPEVTFAVAPA